MCAHLYTVCCALYTVCTLVGVRVVSFPPQIRIYTQGPFALICLRIQTPPCRTQGPITDHYHHKAETTAANWERLTDGSEQGTVTPAEVRRCVRTPAQYDLGWPETYRSRGGQGMEGALMAGRHPVSHYLGPGLGGGGGAWMGPILSSVHSPKFQCIWTWGAPLLVR